MSKLLSLIKATITQDMSLFKIKSKGSRLSKLILPFLIAGILMLYMGIYAATLMEQFSGTHLEYVVLTLFIFLMSIMTIVEGVYKSSSLLFNCKDDNLLLSLPISKNTVLFIRMFKFYLFELLFNSLFILPCMIVYAIRINPAWTYYLVSFISLIILPIIPIIISCIFGFFMTYITIKFKGKNIIQTIITMGILLLILYYSFNTESLEGMLVDNASKINNVLTGIYYPVGAYISMVNDFNILTFILYIVIHLALFIAALFIMGKFYFKFNSKIKRVSIKHNNKPYIVKTRSKARSFIKKEFSRFIYTPVFITNAGFGLVMYVAACIIVSIKYDSLSSMIIEKIPEVTNSMILGYMPVVAIALIAFAAFMTSITSSMISLEGRSFNILKSLPIKSSIIVLYKVMAALVIMLPCILIGDLVMFIAFKFSIINMIYILYASILLPFISELIGIMVNLKYPKMDAINDTEIVKQSTSSMIAVFIGMFLSFSSIGILIGLIVGKMPSSIIIPAYLFGCTILAVLLWIRLDHTSNKSFNSIQT